MVNIEICDNELFRDSNDSVEVFCIFASSTHGGLNNSWAKDR